MGVRTANSGNDPLEANWFVEYYPELGTVVVSNRGTDPNNAVASLTDADFFLAPLDCSLFPGVPSGVESFDVSRITNKQDLLPILPGMFLGFHHSPGEKHILEGDAWVACAGQDNPDQRCSTGAVPNIFEGDLKDN
ncbi:hypothetical protein FRC11_009137, partial [Ceratobasidium sp. 423]